MIPVEVTCVDESELEGEGYEISLAIEENPGDGQLHLAWLSEEMICRLTDPRYEQRELERKLAKLEKEANMIKEKLKGKGE